MTVKRFCPQVSGKGIHLFGTGGPKDIPQSNSHIFQTLHMVIYDCLQLVAIAFQLSTVVLPLPIGLSRWRLYCPLVSPSKHPGHHCLPSLLAGDESAPPAQDRQQAVYTSSALSMAIRALLIVASPSLQNPALQAYGRTQDLEHLSQAMRAEDDEAETHQATRPTVNF